jgi:hypothetical protein
MLHDAPATTVAQSIIGAAAVSPATVLAPQTRPADDTTEPSDKMMSNMYSSKMTYGLSLLVLLYAIYSCEASDVKYVSPGPSWCLRVLAAGAIAAALLSDHAGTPPSLK